MNDDQLTDLLASELFNREYLRKVVPLIRERIDRAEDFIPSTDYFFRGEVVFPPADMKPKKREWRELSEVLEEYSQTIDVQVDFSPAALEAVSRTFAETKGWKTGDLFMPIRVAVTGRSNTPPLFDTMSVLGRALVRRRLRSAVELAKKEAKDEMLAKQKAESEAKKAAKEAAKKEDEKK
jgi:glutamyl-tRNA synthetase